MNGEMPLTDRDFTDIRKSVMHTIEARRTRRVWMVRTAFVIVAMLISRTATTPAPPVSSGGQTLLSVLSPINRGHAGQAKVPVLHDQPHKHRHRRPPAKHHEPEPIRIELATADPDIRIIWITNTL